MLYFVIKNRGAEEATATFDAPAIHLSTEHHEECDDWRKEQITRGAVSIYLRFNINRTKTILESERGDLIDRLKMCAEHSQHGKEESWWDRSNANEDELKSANMNSYVLMKNWIRDGWLDETSKHNAEQAKLIYDLQNESEEAEKNNESLQAAMAVQENEYTSKMNELKGLLTRKCFDYAYEEIAFSLLNEELVKYREMVGVLTSDLTSSEMLNTSLNHQFNQLKEDNDKNSKALLESTVLVNKLEGQLNQAMDSNATLLEQSKSLSASQSKIAKERDLSKLELEALQQRLARSDVKSLTGQVKILLSSYRQPYHL